MARWTRDIALRLAGCALLISAYYEGGLLRHMVARDILGVTSGPWFVGALLFLSATGGCALLLLGHHLNDCVVLSARWTKRGD